MKMRTVSWDEFNRGSERYLDEVLRRGEPLFVRREGRIVLEIAPPQEVAEPERKPSMVTSPHSVEVWRTEVLLEGDQI